VQVKEKERGRRLLCSFDLVNVIVELGTKVVGCELRSRRGRRG
jgi:hypothetical protein